jgi:hypothetical protein
LSYFNPTPIKIGMTGTLSGRQYRVVGRVVLGEQELGGTYYWNEFNLESESGDSATLVYEETDHGPEWRLFHMFDPPHPLSAGEAAAMRIGQAVNLDGTEVFVRLVSKSRVYAIEGKAPEKVGDEARYFNATAGSTMVVVSWTGEEVEFYRGQDLSRATVSAAFNVRIVDVNPLFIARGGRRSLSGLALVGGLVIAVLTVLVLRTITTNRRPVAIVKTGASAVPILAGRSGTLGGTRFLVQSHLLVELALVGRKFDRHEYFLSDEAGNKALLVCGSKPGARDWWLFTPVQPPTPLSPAQAAAVRYGQAVNVDGATAKVSELFQSTVRKVESAEAADLGSGEVFFGFSGAEPSAQLLVRWNGSYINFFQGRSLLEKDILSAFPQAP